MEEEVDRLKPKMMPGDMQSWNIEDLQSYIDAMKKEIKKVEELIAQKTQVQSAAAALFNKKVSE